MTDYNSSEVFFDIVYKDENKNTSLNNFLDTTNGGTIDWFISPEAKDNFVECTDYYCKITCTVYRLFINQDSKNDVQYP